MISRMIFFLILLSIFCIITAFSLAYKRSWQAKIIIWGLFSVLLFSPIISFFLIRITQYVTQDSWSGILGVYAFPLLEIISILMIVIGCIGLIKKKVTKKLEHREN